MVAAFVPGTGAARAVLRAATTWHHRIASRAKTLIDTFGKALILRIRLLPPQNTGEYRNTKMEQEFLPALPDLSVFLAAFHFL